MRLAERACPRDAPIDVVAARVHGCELATSRTHRGASCGEGALCVHLLGERRGIPLAESAERGRSRLLLVNKLGSALKQAIAQSNSVNCLGEREPGGLEERFELLQTPRPGTGLGLGEVEVSRFCPLACALLALGALVTMRDRVVNLRLPNGLARAPSRSRMLE